MLATLKTVTTSCYSVLFLILLVGLTACTPKGPKALLEGEHLLHEGNPAGALPKLKLATELLPQNAQAWNLLGMAYHQTGQLEPAVQAYNHALKLDSNLVVVRYNLGMLWLDNGDSARALNDFKTFTLLQPELVEGWVQRGNAALNLKQWVEAQNCFLKAKSIDANNPEMLNGLGLILLQQHRVRDALSYFNAALQTDANFAPARLNLAVVYHQQLTNYPLALKQYQAYLAITPKPANADAVAAIVKELEPLVPGAQKSSTAPVSISAVAAAARSNAVAAKAEAPTAPTIPKPETNAPVADIAKAQPAAPVMQPPESKPVAPVAPPAIEPAKPKMVAKAEPVARTETIPAVVIPEPAPVPTPPVVKPKPAKVAVAKPAPQPKPVKPANETAAAIPVTPVVSAPEVAMAKPEKVPVAATEEKPSFWQRLNPLTYFREKPKGTTPLGKASSSASTTANTATAKPVVQPAPEPVVKESAPIAKNPPAVVIQEKPAPPPEPRYPYVHPGPFTAGDRKAAQKIFDEGIAAQKDKNWPKAINAYKRAATADPAYFEAYYNLGWTAFEAKDIRLALVAYEHALTVQPDSYDARYNFALTLQQAGFYRDAANEFTRLTKDFPERAQSHLMLAGLLSTRLKDKEEAHKHYQKVLELEPNHPQATEIRYWLRANQ